MDKIPTDLLYYIFKYLHYEQKKQCKLVCRSWAQILHSGLEFETIFILNQDDSCAFTKSAQGIGSSCKRLALNRYQSLVKTATLFPKLQIAAFISDDYDSDVEEQAFDDYTQEEIEQFSDWYQCLEAYIDFQYSGEIFKFLKTGQFQKLGTLELRRDDYASDLLENVITCLNNMPYLKTLVLEKFYFGYTDLNHLHEGAPQLYTLVLDSCSILTHDLPSELPITPTDTMKRLDIIGYDEYSLFREPMYKFMLSKYPNLQYLTLSTSFDACLCMFSPPPPLTIDSDKLIELSLHRHFESSQILNDINKYMSMSLKKLSMGVQFDKPLLSKIVEQVKYTNIVSLSLLDVPNTDFNVFNNLDKLQELKLSFSEVGYTDEFYKFRVMSVTLNTIVKELPASLEILGLSGIILLLISKEDEKQGIWSRSNLKHLEICNCEMPDNLSGYLSNRYFPRLNTLLLEKNIMTHSLLLPDQCFSLVDIRFSDECFIVTVGKDKTRAYKEYYTPQQHRLKAHFDVHDHPMYCVAKPTTTDHDSYFKFECKSVQTLLYNDHLVLV